MRKYLAPMTAVLAAAVALIFLTLRVATSPFAASPVHVTLPSVPTSYLGAFERDAPPSYQPVQVFTGAAHEAPNLVGYFSGWAEPFAIRFAKAVSQHRMIPVVQIDPTYASVQDIADGSYDSYLRSYADSVRAFGGPVVIGFGHEMNAPWYSWGYGHVPAQTFVAAWRHIVSLFRGQGADNVTWMWTINADEPGTGPITTWWPGRQYVTWVGIDGFYTRPSDTFRRIFARTVSQVRVFTAQPILISESAVSPRLNRFAKIGDLFHGVHSFGMLGLVWFDMNQHGGIDQQDWRIEGNLLAETAFRLGAAGLSLVRPPQP
ncbi:MAG: glycoside hydrolase family 26 protein [Streptosporangiaceae bacterium]